jgi:hypothetical protein
MEAYKEVAVVWKGAMEGRASEVKVYMVSARRWLETYHGGLLWFLKIPVLPKVSRT